MHVKVTKMRAGFPESMNKAATKSTMNAVKAFAVSLITASSGRTMFIVMTYIPTHQKNCLMELMMIDKVAADKINYHTR